MKEKEREREREKAIMKFITVARVGVVFDRSSSFHAMSSLSLLLYRNTHIMPHNASRRDTQRGSSNIAPTRVSARDYKSYYDRTIV